MPKRKKARPSQKEKPAIVKGRGIYNGIAPSSDIGDYFPYPDVPNLAKPAKHRRVKRQAGLTYGWNNPLPKFCKCGLPQASRSVASGDRQEEAMSYSARIDAERMDEMLSQMHNPFSHHYRQYPSDFCFATWKSDAKAYIKLKWENLKNKLLKKRK